MPMIVEIQDNAAGRAAINQIVNGVIVGVMQAVCNQTRTLMLTSPRSGALRRGYTGTYIRASAPGEPPAPDTHALEQSITYRQEKPVDVFNGGTQEAGQAGYDGRTNPLGAKPSEYGPRLEFGWQIAARPAWSLAVMMVKARLANGAMPR